MWQTYWYTSVSDTNKGKRLLELRQPNFTSFPTPILLEDRRDEINVFRIRIRHVGLCEYLFRTNQKEDDTCSCGATEDIEHYIFICPQYDAQRTTFCKKLLEIIKPLPRITEKLILGLEDYNIHVNKSILKALCHYIRSTGRNKDI